MYLMKLNKKYYQKSWQYYIEVLKWVQENIRLCVYKTSPETYYRLSECKETSAFKEWEVKLMNELEVRFDIQWWERLS